MALLFCLAHDQGLTIMKVKTTKQSKEIIKSSDVNADLNRLNHSNVSNVTNANHAFSVSRVESRFIIMETKIKLQRWEYV